MAESPIDALSLAALTKMAGGVWQDYHYLSLNGKCSRAMLQFLHDHPKVTQVSLCPGQRPGGNRRNKAAGFIKTRDDPELSGQIALIHPNPPPREYGKDYNEFLLSQLAVIRETQKGRQSRDEIR